MKPTPISILLKNILSAYVGSPSQGIVDLLYGKKNVNEFLISKKLKLTINQTRNVLYKLSDEGFVSFARKKDSKKGGWYTYFWTLNVGKALSRFSETLTNNINHLKSQRDGMKNSRFYMCKTCNLEFTEEQALNNQYTCPECGQVLEVKEMSETLAGLDKEITKLEGQLSKVAAELALVSEEENKVKVKKLKAEERKKKKEREVRKQIRDKEKKKANKISKSAKGKKK